MEKWSLVHTDLDAHGEDRIELEQRPQILLDLRDLGVDVCLKTRDLGLVRGGEVDVEGGEGGVAALQLVIRVHRSESNRLVQRVLNLDLHLRPA